MRIILYKPEHPGNVGAVARAMANFGFDDLVLISPQCDYLSREALMRAKHAQGILRKAFVGDENVLKTFSLLVGTTCRFGTDYNVPRSPLVPSQLPGILRKQKKNKNIGLLFGPEGTGLQNPQIDLCDFVVTIPTSETYPALNMSHAVAILLYELTKDAGEKIVQDHFPLVGTKTKQVLEKTIHDVVNQMYFRRITMAPTQRKVWKKVLGKALITAREAAALIGFFKYWLKKGR